MKDELTALQNKSKALKDSDLYQFRTTSVSDSTIGSSSVSSGAALGNYEFEFFQKPPLEFRRGADAGKVVDSTAVIDSNGFGVGITTGTITINDEIITVQTTDTQATPFTKVTTPDSDLSIVYDTSTDKITLASSSGSTLDLSG